MAGTLLHFTMPGACISCNRDVRLAIFDDNFYSTLGILLSTYIFIAFVIILLYSVAVRRIEISSLPDKQPQNPLPPTITAIVLGVGIGGFIDGIVFHQILQWHEMLSNKVSTATVAGKSVNMFWDGIFHASTLIIVCAGIFSLWNLTKRNDIAKDTGILAGGLLTGWGLFNCVEGTINHHIAGLHNVREYANHDLWNVGFLILSILILITGIAVVYRKITIKK